MLDDKIIIMITQTTANLHKNIYFKCIAYKYINDTNNNTDL